MVKTIGNPLSWTAGAFVHGGSHLAEMTAHVGSERIDKPPVVRKIGMADIGYAIRHGIDDFATFRSDVIFLCLLYPVIGLAMVWMAFQNELVHHIFPLMSGFAILGPIAAVGLYELSRRREMGMEPTWGDALALIRAPSMGAVLVFGVYLLALFSVWMLTAHVIYLSTMASAQPTDALQFFRDAVMTESGQQMMLIGIPVGAAFAVVALSIGVVTVPLLLDRDVGVPVAIATSLKVVAKNPVVTLVWGAIIAVSLAVASVPFLLGLVVVMPILGHASWHLYRRAVD